MALNNYFETLKLATGACEFTLVEDRAVRGRSISPPPKKDNPDADFLRSALRTSASKFTMDECDEPLFCPTRQLSSNEDSEQFPSIDSLEALEEAFSSESLTIDDSHRSCGSDYNVSAKTADSRWAFPTNLDHPVHSRFSTGLKAPARRSV